MGTCNIRLGCQLSFDEQQEADIIKVLETLNSSHKTGQFMSHLIRIACDCPEILDKNSGKFEKGAIIKVMDNVGLSYNRQTFMCQVTKDVDAMKQKVDDMYNMVLKTYILAQMGKQLGLEDKSENHLMAQFILEKQLKELQDTLGLSLTSSAFASSKKQDVEKIANDALEYIIESYSGIVNELKAIVDGANQNYVPAQRVEPVQNETVQNTVENTNNTPVTEEKTLENESNTQDQNDNDEIIDFGNADFSALSNFFND